MSAGGVLGFLVATMVLLIVWAGDTPQPDTAEVAAARQQVQLEQAHRDAQRAQQQADAEEQQAAEASRWRPVRTAAINMLIVFLAMAPIGALIVALTVVSKRRGLIYPRRRDGTLPVRIEQLDPDRAHEALSWRHQAAIAEASTPPLSTYTYAPHFRNQQDIQGAELPPPIGAVPSFRDLPLQVDSVVLGHDGNGLVTRPWDALQSVAVGGGTGSGKTWAGVSLALQAINAGHRIAICDPHAADAESLAGRLAPIAPMLWRPTAVRPTETSATIEAVSQLIDRRATGEDPSREPVTLMVDEFTKHMRGESAERLANLLEGVVSEGRKLAVRVVLLGQRWSASRTGGSGDLRDVLPYVIMMRMRRTDARMLSGMPSDELPDTTRLEPGQAFLLDGDDMVRVAIPRLTPADVAAFAAAVTPVSAHSQLLTSERSVTAGQQRPDSDEQRFADTVIGMFLAGDTVGVITDVLSGTTSRTGSKWRRTRTAVDNVLRDRIRGGT